MGEHGRFAPVHKGPDAERPSGIYSTTDPNWQQFFGSIRLK